MLYRNEWHLHVLRFLRRATDAARPGRRRGAAGVRGRKEERGMDRITPAQARTLHRIRLAVAALALALLAVTGFRWGVQDARQWQAEHAAGPDRR